MAAGPVVVAFVGTQLVRAVSQPATTAAETGGMEPGEGVSIRLSCWLAGTISVPRDVPWEPTTIWRLLPDLPRSVVLKLWIGVEQGPAYRGDRRSNRILLTVGLTVALVMTGAGPGCSF